MVLTNCPFCQEAAERDELEMTAAEVEEAIDYWLDEYNL